MCDLGLHVADIQNALDLCRLQHQSRRGAGYGGTYEHCGCRLDLECAAMGQEHTPQVSPFYGISGSYRVQTLRSKSVFSRDIIGSLDGEILYMFPAEIFIEFLPLVFVLQDRSGLQYVVLTGQSDLVGLIGSLSLDVCCVGGQLRH
jgi:hypothetical protein